MKYLKLLELYSFNNELKKIEKKIALYSSPQYKKGSCHSKN